MLSYAKLELRGRKPVNGSVRLYPIYNISYNISYFIQYNISYFI